MISIGLIPSTKVAVGGIMTGDSMDHSYGIYRVSSIEIPGEDNDGFNGMDSLSGPDDPDTKSKPVK